MDHSLSLFIEAAHPRFTERVRVLGEESLRSIYESCEWWTIELRAYLGDSHVPSFAHAVQAMRDTMHSFCHSSLIQPREVEAAMERFEKWVARASPKREQVMQELDQALVTENKFLGSEPPKPKPGRPLPPSKSQRLHLPPFENNQDDEWLLPF